MWALRTLLLQVNTRAHIHTLTLHTNLHALFYPAPTADVLPLDTLLLMQDNRLTTGGFESLDAALNFSRAFVPRYLQAAPTSAPSKVAKVRAALPTASPTSAPTRIGTAAATGGSSKAAAPTPAPSTGASRSSPPLSANLGPSTRPTPVATSTTSTTGSSHPINHPSPPPTPAATARPYAHPTLLPYLESTGAVGRRLRAPLVPQLQVLDLSRNFFSGPLPSDLFLQVPFLLSFGASDNCLSAHLSPAVCVPQKLRSLTVNGASSRCTYSILGATYSARYRGPLPACLFAMPALRLLHLAGNGYTSSLPAVVSAPLVDINLAHNGLTGVIPMSLLQAFTLSAVAPNDIPNPSAAQIQADPLPSLRSLDLSFNRLKGALLFLSMSNASATSASAGSIGNSSIPENPAVTPTVTGLSSIGTNTWTAFPPLSVKARNNRLSGFLPLDLVSLASVDVLEGNLFNCDATHPLPPSDPAYR